ncbi:hypothetical protein KC19_VG259900 [Ceratodon purpureus]|uniref:Uncharacterized protein n=1 Tax=Ceratodon purpureus TaxID=3225 RepID=A0A8T0HTQ0_CERPU|nr:hypothetical protein KC19_VG259900 [Ceratodon purpureus]
MRPSTANQLQDASAALCASAGERPCRSGECTPPPETMAATLLDALVRSSTSPQNGPPSSMQDNPATLCWLRVRWLPRMTKMQGMAAVAEDKGCRRSLAYRSDPNHVCI